MLVLCCDHNYAADEKEERGQTPCFRFYETKPLR